MPIHHTRPPRRQSGRHSEGSPQTTAIVIGVIVVALAVIGATIYLVTQVGGSGHDVSAVSDGSASSATEMRTVTRTAVPGDNRASALESSTKPTKPTMALYPKLTPSPSSTAETSTTSPTTPSTSSSSTMRSSEPAAAKPAEPTSAASRADDFTGQYWTTGPVSPEFAANVANAFRSHYRSTGSTHGTLTVYSPTTGKSYAMTCSDQGDSVLCEGGDNARVYIPR